jgi:alpha-glucosidase (family GH31 glycosyl hydrolase)
MAVVNRRFEVPAFTSSVTGSSGSGLRIETSQFLLQYEGGSFTAASLKLKVKATGEVWAPGAAATGSLHGTIRTLDRVGSPLGLACKQAAHVNDSHCVEGLLSKSGWALLDDSLGARWDDSSAAWPWSLGPAEPLPVVSKGGKVGEGVCSTAGWDRYQCIFGNKVDRGLCESLGCCFDEQAAGHANGHAAMWNYVPWCYHPSHTAAAPGYSDLYLFARGRDYKATLADFRQLSGPVPQLPRYALGPMYSRWMGYHDFEEREIVATYDRNNVPLDVMIVDMVRQRARRDQLLPA